MRDEHEHILPRMQSDRAGLQGYRKASFEYWSNSSVELKEAWGFLQRLAGGSEDDVVRLEELPRPKVTGSSEMAEILADGISTGDSGDIM